MRRWILTGALAAAVAACASGPGPAPEPPPGAGDSVRMTGTLSVAGSGPVNTQVVLRPASGASVALEGPLAGELRRLGGVVAEVWGRRAANGVTVEGYRPVSADGAPVWFGTVEAGPGGTLRLRLDDGRTVELTAPPAELRPGVRAWVQGPASVGVQTFTVVSP